MFALPPTFWVATASVGSREPRRRRGRTPGPKSGRRDLAPRQYSSGSMTIAQGVYDYSDSFGFRTGSKIGSAHLDASERHQHWTSSKAPVVNHATRDLSRAASGPSQCGAGPRAFNSGAPQRRERTPTDLEPVAVDRRGGKNETGRRVAPATGVHFKPESFRLVVLMRGSENACTRNL
jgi:hypothetical protein